LLRDLFHSNQRSALCDVHSLLQNRPLFLAICPGSLWARDNRWLLSRVQRLARPVGGTGAFCPGLRHQPGQKARVAFCPGWNHQPGQKSPLLSRLVPPTGAKGLAPLIPFPLPPPEPFSSLVFLLFLARDRGVLAHFFTTFVKIFDSPSIHLL
jgi:hypothetical protein